MGGKPAGKESFEETYANFPQRPITKDVCIFCTTQLQFASTRPTSRPQRRFFKSSSVAQRPPAAAAARKEEQADQGWSADWKSEPAPRQSGGGWTSNAAPRDLTPEEHALRNALQSGPAFSPTISKHESLGDDRQIYGAQGGGNRGFQRSRGIDSSRPPHNREGNGFARKSSASGGYYRKLSANDPTGSSRVTDSGPPNFQKATTQRSQSHTSENGQPSTSKSGFGFTFRMPSWDCTSCGYNNFSGSTCRKCRSDRLASVIRKPTSTPAPPLSRADRDVQLDHHIAQTRARPDGDWNCPKCEFDNNRGNRYCGECGTIRSTKEIRDARADGVRAESWKHLRRRGDIRAEQHDHDQSARVELPRNSEVHARIEAAERERMMRLERTRNGRYVDLRRGQDAAREEVVARTPEMMNESTSKASQMVQPQPVESKSEDGRVSWESFPMSESSSNHPAGSGKAAPSPKPTKALKGWEYPAEDATAAEVIFKANDSTQAFTAEKSPEQPLKVRSLISYDSDFDRDLMPRRPQTIGSSGLREPERRGRNSGIEVTSAPNDRNRYKERKSKKFVSEMDFDEDDESVLRAERKKQRKQKVEKNKAFQKAAAAPTPIHLPEFISVSNLAGVLRVRVEDFAYKMKGLGFAETNNDHVLDAETAGLIAAEFNYEPIIERSEDRDLLPLPPAEDKSVLPPRPPVVTIMGHVDHGKTTLLDYLRKSSVAASEHGGITQHIGAFSVPMPGGRLVTFLDTPGHEAFLSMRQRGANVTDIVILVVAADDSVKPQTVEAIKHAQAAKVPMIVAVNKIDKEDSNVEKVKQDLARYGVEIEDYGGDTQVVCVSGKTGQGMEELEDAAVALADILDMRSEIDGRAEGWVLEATTKKAGRVATILVRRGTLRPGNVIVAGTSWARVRSLRNEAGAVVPSAGPGTPVEIDGWREQPAAGDEVIQAPDEQKAKSVIEYRLEASERRKLAADMEAVNEARRLEQEKREQLEKTAQLAETTPQAAPPPPQPQDATTTSSTPTFQEVFFIVKADVSGSVEAVTNSVSALGNSEIRPHILRSGVGPVSEFDVDHAAVAKGHIINFNTTIEGPIQRMAESKDVQIIDQSIIYRLVDDVKTKLGERLAPIVTQRVLGEAEVAQVFEINTKGRATVPVAGCKVRNGVVSKTGRVRVVRGKEVVFDGLLSSLKNVKKDVAEMRKGNECGMSFENWTGFQAGDLVQAYEESVEKRTL